jgi:hypothetical protein
MRQIDDNPRAVHREIVAAFLNRRSLRIGSRYSTDGITLRVWGNVVASRTPQGITLRDAGYRTLLTKNVLNELLEQIGIPGGHIRQVNRVWMLGDRPWPGEVLVPAKVVSKMSMSGAGRNPILPDPLRRQRAAHKRRLLAQIAARKKSLKKHPYVTVGRFRSEKSLRRGMRALQDEAGIWTAQAWRPKGKSWKVAVRSYSEKDARRAMRGLPRQNPTEYRTVDTRTVKGLEIAEKLRREGWSMGRVGPFTTQFYRRKCQKCGGWMETQGKWGGVERLVCDKCGDEQRRRCETNPLTRRESASLLRDARYRAGLSGSFSKGEASGMARSVRRYGPVSARRTAHKVVAVAHGWPPKEVKYDPSAWTNPRRNPCGTRHNASKKDLHLVSVPPHFSTHCYGCGKRVRTVEEALYADLKGPAFKAYYCSECAHVKKPGVQSNPACGICRGPLVPLGRLGNLMWYRCRNCGMDQYRKKKR